MNRKFNYELSQEIHFAVVTFLIRPLICQLHVTAYYMPI
jgi:hypothetical protein